LPNVELATLAHRAGAGIADVGVVRPQDDLALAGTNAAIDVGGEGVERLGHVLVAQVPRGDAAAEHRAIVALGVAREACVLLGREKFVFRDVAVALGELGGAALEFEELLDDRFLLGTAEEVAEQILALRRRFGVSYLCVSVHLAGTPKEVALEQMQILAEEVFPRVAGTG
jgi:alkanesulfonate monooxygenase SsuD/methylene tetrahydromethanopterin reductase-like flavin-dependent oxidoreductase (luciferase family)